MTSLSISYTSKDTNSSSSQKEDCSPIIQNLYWNVLKTGALTLTLLAVSFTIGYAILIAVLGKSNLSAHLFVESPSATLLPATATCSSHVQSNEFGIKFLSSIYAKSVTFNESGQRLLEEEEENGVLPASLESKNKVLVTIDWDSYPSTVEDATTFLKLFKVGFSEFSNNRGIDILLFPPLPFLSQSLMVFERTSIKVGAKDFTEDRAALSTMEELGCDYVMLGSLRDNTKNLTNINSTARSPMKSKLLEALEKTEMSIFVPITELGDEDTVESQIEQLFKGVSATDLKRIVVVYKTGKGEVDKIRNGISLIESSLKMLYPNEEVGEVRIVHGGSIMNNNQLAGMYSIPNLNGMALSIQDSFELREFIDLFDETLEIFVRALNNTKNYTSGALVQGGFGQSQSTPKRSKYIMNKRKEIKPRRAHVLFS